MSDFNVIDGKWVCAKCKSEDVTETNVIPEAPMTTLVCNNCGWAGGVGKVLEKED
jgi:transcription elongation factor Elf1